MLSMHVKGIKDWLDGIAILFLGWLPSSEESEDRALRRKAAGRSQIHQSCKHTSTSAKLGRPGSVDPFRIKITIAFAWIILENLQSKLQLRRTEQHIVAGLQPSSAARSQRLQRSCVEAGPLKKMTTQEANKARPGLATSLGGTSPSISMSVAHELSASEPSERERGVKQDKVNE